jgi:hypothetical protein
VQDSSALTPGAAGLFYAGNGANLLAPAFGGQPLPSGCLFNASCGKAGFPKCCQQVRPPGLSSSFLPFPPCLP